MGSNVSICLGVKSPLVKVLADLKTQVSQNASKSFYNNY